MTQKTKLFLKKDADLCALLTTVRDVMGSFVDNSSWVKEEIRWTDRAPNGEFMNPRNSEYIGFIRALTKERKKGNFELTRDFTALEVFIDQDDGNWLGGYKPGCKRIVFGLHSSEIKTQLLTPAERTKIYEAIKPYTTQRGPTAEPQRYLLNDTK
jgi:hypothetical protein